MEKMKRVFSVFAVLIILFITSAILFGEYHSALSVIWGFAGCALFYEIDERYFK